MIKYGVVILAISIVSGLIFKHYLIDPKISDAKALVEADRERNLRNTLPKPVNVLKSSGSSSSNHIPQSATYRYLPVSFATVNRKLYVYDPVSNTLVPGKLFPYKLRVTKLGTTLYITALVPFGIDRKQTAQKPPAAYATHLPPIERREHGLAGNKAPGQEQ